MNEINKEQAERIFEHIEKMMSLPHMSFLVLVATKRLDANYSYDITETMLKQFSISYNYGRVMYHTDCYDHALEFRSMDELNKAIERYFDNDRVKFIRSFYHFDYIKNNTPTVNFYKQVYEDLHKLNAYHATQRQAKDWEQSIKNISYYEHASKDDLNYVKNIKDALEDKGFQAALNDANMFDNLIKTDFPFLTRKIDKWITNIINSELLLGLGFIFSYTDTKHNKDGFDFDQDCKSYETHLLKDDYQVKYFMQPELIDAAVLNKNEYMKNMYNLQHQFGIIKTNGWGNGLPIGKALVQIIHDYVNEYGANAEEIDSCLNKLETLFPLLEQKINMDQIARYGKNHRFENELKRLYLNLKQNLSSAKVSFKNYTINITKPIYHTDYAFDRFFRQDNRETKMQDIMSELNIQNEYELENVYQANLIIKFDQEMSMQVKNTFKKQLNNYFTNNNISPLNIGYDDSGKITKPISMMYITFLVNDYKALGVDKVKFLIPKMGKKKFDIDAEIEADKLNPTYVKKTYVRKPKEHKEKQAKFIMTNILNRAKAV